MTPNGLQERPSGNHHLPWHITGALMVAVCVVALLRPLAPHGVFELLSRLAGFPLRLSIESTRYVELTVQTEIKTACQAFVIRWSPDSKSVFLKCSNELREYDRSGNLLAVMPLEYGYSLDDGMMATGKPLRLYHADKPQKSTTNQFKVMVWNVGAPVGTEESVGPNSNFSYAIEPSSQMIAVAELGHKEIALYSPDGADAWTKIQSFDIPSQACSLRWIPGTNSALFGTYDGMIGTVTKETGQIRNLARPYSRASARGTREESCVEGLAVSPDSERVATFGSSGIFSATTAPMSSVEADSSEDAFSNAVEIRSVDDGRLIAAMPGYKEIGTRHIDWDPKDRFIAVSGHDALHLWDWHTGRRAVETFAGGLFESAVDHPIAISPDGSLLVVGYADHVGIYRIDEKN